MVQYIQALEGFDRECEAMHTNIIMGEFMATESVGSSIKAGVQAAWEKLKKLVLGIWEKIKGLGRMIKESAQKIIAMIRKSPDDATPVDGKAIVDECRALNEFMTILYDSAEALFDDVDNLRKQADNLNKADLRELNSIEADVADALKRYRDALAEEEKAEQAYDKICQEWEAEVDAGMTVGKSKEWREENNRKIAEIETRKRAADDVRKAAHKKSSDYVDNAINETFDGKERYKSVRDSLREKATDSFLVEPATEAEGHKFNLRSIKDRMTKVMEQISGKFGKLDQVMDDIKSKFESIKNSSSSDQEANRKQSLLSRIVNLVSRIGGFLKSAPGKIAGAFKKLWGHIRGPKSKVKPYNGPSPVAATDSYLYDPELAVEIG